MKREIKFRGRNKDGKWLYGNLAKDTFYVRDLKFTSSVIFDNLQSFNTDNFGLVVKDCSVEDDTVGQYIGLHDKNGKEIYEGDILRMCNTDEDDVYWDTRVGVGGVVYCSTCDYDYTLLKWVDDYIEYEVIGNIYDNPDLKNE